MSTGTGFVANELPAGEVEAGLKRLETSRVVD
jgi:hypothetical protein